MGKYLSCGKYNHYYKYIILAIVFGLISSSLFGYGYCNYINIIYFGRVYPDDIRSTQESLSHHIIIHNIYRNFGILIISIILTKYVEKNTKSEKIEELDINNNKITNSIELIYKENIAFKSNKSFLFFSFIILLFNIQDILSNIYFDFDLREFNLWALDLPLFSYFNYKLLNNPHYGHHKLAIYICLIFPLLQKIIHIFSLVFSKDYEKFIYNKYKALSFIGIFSYLIIILIKSYTLTKIKIYMEFNYISPTKILLNIGIIGTLINIIIMIAFTFIKCGTVNDIDIHLCNVDDNGNRKESYLENFYLYFKILNNTEYYNIIISIFSNLIGVFTYYGCIYFYILTIKYLSTIHTIIYSSVYSFIIRIVAFIISSSINSYFDKEEKFTPLASTLSTISDVFSCIGILIYCEIIELNFCKFNYFLRRNIMIRSEEETNINNNSDNLLDDEKDLEIEESNCKMINLVSHSNK